MFRFEKLEIWKEAIEYADEMYNLAEKLPSDEKYNLIGQLKRASLSIPNNIAEGSGASTKKSFCSFLDIGISSALETVNLLYFAQMRNYITEEVRLKFYNKAELLIKKVYSFKNSLK